MGSGLLCLEQLIAGTRWAVVVCEADAQLSFLDCGKLRLGAGAPLQLFCKARAIL